MNIVVRAALVAVIVVTASHSAEAQSTTAADVLSFLLTNQRVATGDFQKDQAATAATRDTITRALLVNLSTIPLPASSSGFVYVFDPDLGTAVRQSANFGPFFVQRASMSGRGGLTLGASASTAAFDRLNGLPLRDGTLVTTANQFTDETTPFDVETLTLRLSTTTMTVFGSYAATGRLELGAVVPFVQLRLDGERINVYRGDRLVQASAQARSSGLSDVALRAKFIVLRSGGSALAAATEVTLPTGAAANLLGDGTTSARFVAIFSHEHGAIGLHVNGGVSPNGNGKGWDASGAVAYAVHPRVSLSAEILVRRLTSLYDVVPVAAPHPTLIDVETLRLVPGDRQTVLSNYVSGVKWNLGSTCVLSGQVRWRLGSGGLTTSMIPTLNLDYLF